ncbi:MAG: hypothetical protein IT435_04365 [Phycisphaerales bacterium]|nr:hypothetical protein [Phycisphaerales bacterium]
MIPRKPRDAIELTPRELVVLAEPPATFRPRVLVATAVHSATLDTQRNALSIAGQRMDAEDLGAVLLLDTHGPGPFTPPVPPALRGRVWVLRANCGSPARARNTMLEFVERQVPSCHWVARLDWDDRFAEVDSLSAAVAAGENAGARFVVGGNRVVSRDGGLLRVNPAGGWMRDPEAVRERLRGMATGEAPNELPSCNLVLNARAGYRYPDTASAEDHWLVADLLLNHAREGAIADAVLFADYTLDGERTTRARSAGRHRASRQELLAAADTWLSVAGLPGRVLGLGQEGIVREHAGTVFKHFYPGILSSEKVDWLRRALRDDSGLVPAATFEPVNDHSWLATYPWNPTAPFVTPDERAVADFLKGSLRCGIVCGNVKRSNFRVGPDGRLLYIDIGNWVVPMDVSVLRDSAARLYSIGVLGASDDELLRRPADHTGPVVWDRLPGFTVFFRAVVAEQLSGRWQAHLQRNEPAAASPRRHDVSLLIKACAMDAPYLEEQVRHIVGQLVGPGDFAERLLLIDPHPGPFIRPHNDGSLDAVHAAASRLVSDGLLDRVRQSPADADSVSRINERWFGAASVGSHSIEGIPVTPQVWAFDQVATRYVLQCDADVLIGRLDYRHDYLQEMVAACSAAEAVGVAFNIPHDPASGPRPYEAPAGGHKPEVRCGLLDLQRLRSLLPLPNRLRDGILEQPWYRALHASQRQHGLRTLRGGDPRTFYLHPPNSLKVNADAVWQIRDLVEQGRVPASHHGRWDVEPETAEWAYPRRSEAVVILARGRNTPPAKVDRFAAGLAMQTDQSFGVIAIDDASDQSFSADLHRRLGFLGNRLTLVRHRQPRGRMANNVLAVRELCADPRSLVVTVDLDDALVEPETAARLRLLHERGHDLVLAAPFRPDAPTKVYQPEFGRAREAFGGDVWIHLRAVRKALFDLLPDDLLKLNGAWLDMCDDYAVMVPLSEVARNPVYVGEYWYWHERTTGKTEEELRAREDVIERLLARPPLPRVT